MKARILLVATVSSILASCKGDVAAPPAPSPPMTLGVLPAIDAANTKRNYQPLADAIAQVVQRPVHVKVAASYDELGRDLASGSADLVQLSAYLHVLHKHGTHTVLVQEEMIDDGKYRGVFVVREDSSFRSIADLKDKRFAWVHRGSSGGYYYGRMRMRELGLDPDAHFAETVFAGSHEKLAHQVSEKEVDGGLISWWTLPEAEKLRIIDRTAVVADDVIAASGAVPTAQRQAIRDFFLSAHARAELKQFFLNRGLKRYVEPNPDDYLDLAAEVAAGR